MKRFGRTAETTLAGVLVTVALLNLVGCTPDWEQARAARSLERGGGGNVDEAISYLPLLMRFDRSVAVKEVTYQLNSWARRYDASGDAWPKSLVEQMATTWTTPLASPYARRLGEIGFRESECEYLLQCRLMKHVSDWVIAAEYRDPLFHDWLAGQREHLSADASEKLQSTLKLFDWTTRNIALEGASTDAEQLAAEPTAPLNDYELGYRQLPWQTLMIARGDVWQRARVFTQLLQQAGLTGVILAIDRDAEPDLLWAIAVPIEDQLFLFEPRWGLPLPGPGGVGVATLKQAQSDRTVLRRANLPGQFEYPVSTDQLSKLTAKIDVEPFAIGHSSFALQRSLAGESRMRISVDLTPIVTALEKQVGAGQSALWDLPVMAQAYSESVRARMGDQSAFSMQYLAYYGPFITDTLMNVARRDHLAGKFKSSLDEAGALRNYMSLRVDDATLDKLPYDQTVQQSLQVKRGANEPLEAFQARLEQVKAYYKAAKYQTSTFLGMAQFDLGNLDAARDWLDERTLSVRGTEAWHPQAEYLLGRIYEVKGEHEKAAEFYKRIGRPQEAGNRIRARLLQTMNEAPAG